MKQRVVAGLLSGVFAGLAVGVALYTFVYARGASYLADDPAACANCHVMQQQYDGWNRASHRAAAGCNDCHTPAGFLSKYATKASNGFWHSFAFTSGRFHEPIRIKTHNLEILERACRNCHAPIVDAIETHPDAPAIACTRCHGQVGHF